MLDRCCKTSFYDVEVYRVPRLSTLCAAADVVNNSLPLESDLKGDNVTVSKDCIELCRPCENVKIE